ncbi:hypothetical protein AOL_s00006g558 [Orbilia oligospora ATCC 24927]|uniref:Uncharacterized protein n=1 Tax=Arthrobotrys oligospora (strain ATCC 24927 / CBS 115.81 / DSM 1491) TaxID=756982 RepID=G1X107_ARTOA|nr:hypothetical protein AOL_s00006g558 [Orbilia oligospora ATCC 24927]EGX53180.1 hypothetical protein AOL_s00006g558 [Orbilia oligospora ATCC 24927]
MSTGQGRSGPANPAERDKPKRGKHKPRVTKHRRSKDGVLPAGHATSKLLRLRLEERVGSTTESNFVEPLSVNEFDKSSIRLKARKGLDGRRYLELNCPMPTSTNAEQKGFLKFVAGTEGCSIFCQPITGSCSEFPDWDSPFEYKWVRIRIDYWAVRYEGPSPAERSPVDDPLRAIDYTIFDRIVTRSDKFPGATRLYIVTKAYKSLVDFLKNFERLAPVDPFVKPSDSELQQRGLVRPDTKR